ncbi:MAG TPA: DUF998 domain-containing protein [Actinomycetes bacterium]|nr:DUF998 domain-containing protein [Actinomycetes bacterium]
MTQNLTTPRAGAHSPPTATTTNATRALLACGVAAGPLFVVVGLLQMLSRDGFDPTRHPLSLLSLGGLGWIQISNFVVAGLLFVASAVGMHPRSRPGVARRPATRWRWRRGRSASPPGAPGAGRRARRRGRRPAG